MSKPVFRVFDQVPHKSHVAVTTEDGQQPEILD